MVRILLILLLSLSTKLLSAVADPSTAEALFVLGDSSASCNLSPLHFSVPFCNTGLLPNLIAERMGLPELPLFDQSNKTAKSLAAGVNFASDPGKILSGGGIGGVFQLHSLSQQVRQVTETLQIIRLELGPAAASHIVSSALFLLSFGKDDYTSLLAAGANPDPKRGRRGFSRILASEMIRAVQDLYGGGVRRVAVMAVAPLGCAPRVVLETYNVLGSHNCVDEANEIIARYNVKLSAELEKLSSSLPDAKFVFCDVYAGMMEIIANPLSYGFENVRDACCGVGPFGAMAGCLFKEMACAEPQKHIWWDLYSPTKAVNEVLANWSWFESDMHICKPVSLQRLTQPLS